MGNPLFTGEPQRLPNFFGAKMAAAPAPVMVVPRDNFVSLYWTKEQNMNKNKDFAKWLRNLKKENKRAFLITSRAEYSYEDYLEWCEDMDEDPAPENSSEFYNWVANSQTMMWEDDQSNIEHSSTLKPYKVLITGRLGLWWGHPSIYPEIRNSLIDAIHRCCDGSDDLEAEYDDKCIYVNGYHHDGTNSFQLYLIKPTANIEELERRIAQAKNLDPENGFDPENSYNRRFFEKITDWLF